MPVFSERAIRGWFCVAVAFIALAVADPLTEWASNRGLFGPGEFTDHSNADALPVLLAGLLFAAFHLAARGRYAARASEYESRRWFAAWGRVLDRGTVMRLLPRAFALQIAALWIAETLEQFIVVGHGLGGIVWLGAPIVAAIVLHAAFCLTVGLVAALGIRAFASTALRVACFVAAFTTLSPGETKSTFRRRSFSPARRMAAPLVCRIGERAPPFATV